MYKPLYIERPFGTTQFQETLECEFIDVSVKNALEGLPSVDTVKGRPSVACRYNHNWKREIEH